VTFGFNFTVQTGQTYFIDPAVATGYIYKTGSGDPNFASVELPDIGNSSPYDLYLWNGSAFVFDTTLAADTLFDFAAGGVSEFEVLGIDPSLGLDPTNPTAFITALTFEGAGSFTGTMTPITTNVSIPEPTSLVLLISGLLGLGLMRGYRNGVKGIRTLSMPLKLRNLHHVLGFIRRANSRFALREGSDRGSRERRQGGAQFA
jgi:hypothetical protein